MAGMKRKAEGGEAPVDYLARHKKILEEREALPITSARDRLIEEVKANPTLIVIGETGSGKTTQIPQFLHDAGFTQGGRAVAVTQPRRVAAVTVAKRVAEEMGVELGEEVGYSIRFEDATSRDTRLKYMTDGMLLREALLDPLLQRYRVVVLDEAHERTVHTDVLFGLLKGVQRRRAEAAAAGGVEGGGDGEGGGGAGGAEAGAGGGWKGGGGGGGKIEPLHLVVMSATLDAKGFCEYFGGAKAVYVQGRQFEVDVLYTPVPEDDYMDAAIVTAFQIHLEEEPGDILCFLTGQDEIESVDRLLRERMRRMPEGAGELIVRPIFAAMPGEQQMLAFEPAPPGTRKIILATNIAETSLTIPGIRYVIDPGLVKARGYNPKLGSESLAVVPVSQAQARQRSGRAGREAPGVCYRLYTEAAFDKLSPTTRPEIQRCSLGSIVLQLKAMGIDDVLGFDFLDPPPRASIVKSLELLLALGALDSRGKLTDLGRSMARLPIEPMLAKVVLASEKFGCSEEILAVVAMLSADSVFFSPQSKRAEAEAAHRRFVERDGDHLTLLNVYEAYKQAPQKERARWCRDNFINARSMRRAVDVHKQLVGHFTGIGIKMVGIAGDDRVAVRQCLASGFFLNAARKQPDGATYRVVATGQVVHVHPTSVLHKKKPECVIFNELVRTTRPYMRDLSLIDPRWLVECAPQVFAVQR